MATAVYTVEEVELQDGTTVELRPLPIRGLRKFMERIDELAEVSSNDEAIDIYLDCSAFCLKKQKPEFWDDAKERGEREVSVGKKKEMKKLPSGGYTELAEEALDMPTIFKILDVCGGIKLDDPNLQAAARAAALGQLSTSQD